MISTSNLRLLMWVIGTILLILFLVTWKLVFLILAFAALATVTYLRRRSEQPGKKRVR
jgi:membrane protein implicated in regulation of membrane protease activity